MQASNRRAAAAALLTWRVPLCCRSSGAHLLQRPGVLVRMSLVDPPLLHLRLCLLLVAASMQAPRCQGWHLKGYRWTGDLEASTQRQPSDIWLIDSTVYYEQAWAEGSLAGKHFPSTSHFTHPPSSTARRVACMPAHEQGAAQHAAEVARPGRMARRVACISTRRVAWYRRLLAPCISDSYGYNRCVRLS